MSKTKQCSNRVVLISGAASGIGSCVAAAFLRRGDAVHICDASRQRIDAFLNQNDAATATCADVAVAANTDEVFADLKDHYGRLDVLINNAGIAGPTAAIQEIDDDDWDRCIAVDLSGAFYLTKRAVPLLLESQRASIVNISSTAGLFGYPERSPYVAAKWALIGLTKTWAMELGPRGVRVNAICPGSIEGKRIDEVIADDAANRGQDPDVVRQAYLRQSSMRTFASADDIAAMALFLASREAARISGQVIAVDGHTENLSKPF